MDNNQQTARGFIRTQHVYVVAATSTQSGEFSIHGSNLLVLCSALYLTDDDSVFWVNEIDRKFVALAHVGVVASAE